MWAWLFFYIQYLKQSSGAMAFSLKALAASPKLAFSHMLITSFQLTHRINPNTAYRRVLGYSGVSSCAPNVLWLIYPKHLPINAFFILNYLSFGEHMCVLATKPRVLLMRSACPPPHWVPSPPLLFGSWLVPLTLAEEPNHSHMEKRCHVPGLSNCLPTETWNLHL